MKISHEIIKRMREEAKETFMEAVRAVDPYEAVKNSAVVSGNTLRIGAPDKDEIEFKLNEFKEIFVVGAGKATAPMARAVEDILGNRISRGIINVKYGFTDKLKKTDIIEAGHPIPDENGVKGTKQIIELLNSAGENDLIISLISGGGSALLPMPQKGITFEHKQQITKELLNCGASIDEINAVRKHISLSKGGQLARIAYPATTINLMLSDVVGDRMDVIASGPFVPDESTFEKVWDIFQKYEILDKVPEPIKRHIKSGLNKEVEETPKKDDPVFQKVSNLIIGSNIVALKSAKKKAEEFGYNGLILSSMVEGETKEIAIMHSAIAKEVLSSGNPVSSPACIISGGETTVTIKGDGMGGRNQEFCLSCAIEISGLHRNVVVLSGGTDGNDGPTDSAGGIVDPFTISKAREMGLNEMEFLMRNDSYNFLKHTGDLLITGPTKTNVMDVRLILIR